MKKRYILIFSLPVILIMSFHIYAKNEKEALSEGVLRLHVVAESNSREDQMLKLKVRDAVLLTAKELFEGAGTKYEAIEIACENKDKITKAAEDVLKSEGCFLPVRVEVGKTRFPTKKYENIRLPQGVYDSVNVKIGKAEGENWWCVMYPMLCFSSSVSGRLDSKSEKLLREELGDAGFSLVSDTGDPKINIKFKILELF